MCAQRCVVFVFLDDVVMLSYMCTWIDLDAFGSYSIGCRVFTRCGCAVLDTEPSFTGHSISCFVLQRVGNLGTVPRYKIRRCTVAQVMYWSTGVLHTTVIASHKRRELT